MALMHPAAVPPADPKRQTVPRPQPPFDKILAELREMRRLQEQILTLLQNQAAPPPPMGFPPVVEAPVAAAAPAAKRVLIVDDDPRCTSAVAAALEVARVGVEVVADGNAALAAIARDRPHAIVMELEVGGPMAGKDVVNMLRATMEWVDIPVVLYTRTPIASLEDARAVHGGDAFVPKAAGADALVSCLRSILVR